MQRAVNEAVVRGKGDGDYAATMFGVVELRLDDAQRRSRQAPPGAWTPISPAPPEPYQLLPSLQQTSNLFTPKLNIKIWYRSYTHLQKQKLNQIIVTLNIKDLRVISNDASEVVVHIDHSLSQRKQESVSNYFAPIDMPNQRLL